MTPHLETVCFGLRITSHCLSVLTAPEYMQISTGLLSAVQPPANRSGSKSHRQRCHVPTSGQAVHAYRERGRSCLPSLKQRSIERILRIQVRSPLADYSPIDVRVAGSANTEQGLNLRSNVFQVVRRSRVSRQYGTTS